MQSGYLLVSVGPYVGSPLEIECEEELEMALYSALPLVDDILESHDPCFAL